MAYRPDLPDEVAEEIDRIFAQDLMDAQNGITVEERIAMDEQAALDAESKNTYNAGGLDEEGTRDEELAHEDLAEPSSASQDQPKKKKGKWIPEEDAKLKRLREQGMSWEDITKEMSDRTASACKNRYSAHLIRQGQSLGAALHWTPEEDALLIALRENGQDFDAIALRLRGRSREGCLLRFSELVVKGQAQQLSFD